MLLKNILITTAWLLLPMTVFASGRLCESASAVVRNWKGEYIQADEPVLDEELTSTLYSEDTLFVDEMDPTSDDLNEPDPTESTTEEVGEEFGEVVEEQ
jgi:hypothetical protein